MTDLPDLLARLEKLEREARECKQYHDDYLHELPYSAGSPRHQELVMEINRTEGELKQALRNAAPLLIAGLRLAMATSEYEDAVECCDCEPTDWRCGHAVKTKSDVHSASLTAFRAALSATVGK